MAILEIPNESIIRSKELHQYSLLDTMPEEEYDSITKYVAEICNTPICIISLIDIDRQFFKSSYGFDFDTPDLEYSFCNSTIKNKSELLIINDSSKDIRFKDNPLTKGQKGIVFYAGAPLVTSNGIAIGSLCVVDHQPKELTEIQKKTMLNVASWIIKLFELRKSNIELENANLDLKYKNIEMEKFAYTAAHDIKSPLNHIIQINEIIQEELSSGEFEHVKMLIDTVSNSANKLRSLIDGILNHTKSDSLGANTDLIDFSKLVSSVFSLFKGGDEYEFVGPENDYVIKTDKIALEQILINLVGNAIKHNDKEYVSVQVDVVKKENIFKILVTDNGPGISKSDFGKIFNIFEKLSDKDRFGNYTSGIGLATVKKLANAMGAQISVDSILKCGTTFILELPRAVK